MGVTSSTGNCENGTGHTVWKDKSSYTGGWLGGKPHGSGCFIWPNQSRYIGDFIEGKKHGHGVQYRPDGSVEYTGEWHDDRPHGIGTARWVDGSTYSGTFQDWNPEGAGVKKWPKSDGGATYAGAFSKGVPHGQGRSTLPDGTIHEGQWNRGFFPIGVFQLIYATGAVWHGAVMDGLAHGSGTLTLPKRYVDEGEPLVNDSYVGTLARGRREGLGTYEWGNDAHFYSGAWKNNQRHGMGKMTMPNGVVFDGMFANNRAHGKGSLTRKEGTISGEFKNDWLAISTTRCVRADGSEFVGDVHQGQPHGTGELRVWNGGIHQGIWTNGVLSGLVTLASHTGKHVWEGRLPGPGEDALTLGIQFHADGSRRLGRWRENELLEEIPVPTAIIRSKERLGEKERSASLLYPNGDYFIGTLNQYNQRTGSGTMFNADGNELQRGEWLDDQLQLPPSMPPAPVSNKPPEDTTPASPASAQPVVPASSAPAAPPATSPVSSPIAPAVPVSSSSLPANADEEQIDVVSPMPQTEEAGAASVDTSIDEEIADDSVVAAAS